MNVEDAIQILKEILEKYDDLPALDKWNIWLEFSERIENLCVTGKTN